MRMIMRTNKGVWRYAAVAALVLFLSVMLSGRQTQAASAYKIKVNTSANVVTIYKRQSNGRMKPIKAMTCSSGAATPVGTFSLGEKMRWHVLMGPCYGQYCTRIHGGILFHSVWYYKMDPSTLSSDAYNKLGTQCSHGCIRLCVADVKYIYDKIPSGTPVQIYNSSKPGPLGKPRTIKIPAGSGWDPTDIWSKKNPWNKKKPKITGARNLTVEYGSSVDLLAGIKGTNTTGYDATDLIRYKIKYHGSSVKKIKSKTPGTYRVTYILKDEIGRKVTRTVKVKVQSSLETPQFSGVTTRYVNSENKLKKSEAMKGVTVTQGGKKLDEKYVTVTFTRIADNVYRAVYRAQNASLPATAKCRFYVDQEAPQIQGVTPGAIYAAPVGQQITEEYARSYITGVSDNLNKLKISDVVIGIKAIDATQYQVTYTLQDKAGNKTQIVTTFVMTKAEQTPAPAPTEAVAASVRPTTILSGHLPWRWESPV